jgi:hypothetical protein
MEEFNKELENLLFDLEQIKIGKINELKNKYKNKLNIKIGDIIYNVTGIIQVEDIDFVISDRFPSHVVFKGTKYKWIKDGFITKTKTNKKGELYSYSNLKMIDKKMIKL